MSDRTVFEHNIRVGWAQCDPAKIAFTGWIPWWALEAIDAWWSAHLGQGWYELELDRNVGTPFVRIEMDFRAPITPRDRLSCHVRPVRLGDKSVTFGVSGRQGGTLCFEGRFTSVFVIADQFKSQSAPPDLRAVLEPFLPAPEAPAS